MLMKLFDRQSHLQNKLAIYSLFWFIFGLLATYLVTVILIKLYMNAYLVNQSTVYCQQTARDITAIIDRDKEAVSAFLLSDTMRDLGNQTRLTVAIERLLSRNRNFFEGYVVNLEGETLVSVSQLRAFTRNRPDFRKENFYREARRGRIGISGWENFEDINQPYWHMAVPIEKFPGAITGVLIVTIDLRRIEDIILTSQGAKYGNPILFDHNGKVLVHLDRSKLGNDWAKCPVVQRVIRGEIGTAHYRDTDGKLLIAAYQPLFPYNWGFIIYVYPEQMIGAFRNKLVILLGLMITVIIIFTVPLTYLVAGRIVTPIKELTRASQKFGRGEKPEYTPVNGNDEIAQLSTAFYEMAASIEDQEKQRAQYISMIAHELRNPLTLITEYFYNLPDGAHASDKKLKSFGLSKLAQVNRMIGDLLEFSRLDLGQVNFSPETVSVKYLCEDVIAGYRDWSGKFKLQPFSEQICVRADPLRLQQIIQNIFDNNIKYTPPECILTIDCRENPETVEIILSDNGPGIPAEVLDDIFKPFKPNLHQKKGSYNLGLAIIKRLATGMNGDIKVESAAGKGAVFRISLPKSAVS